MTPVEAALSTLIGSVLPGLARAGARLLTRKIVTLGETKEGLRIENLSHYLKLGDAVIKQLRTAGATEDEIRQAVIDLHLLPVLAMRDALKVMEKTRSIMRSASTDMPEGATIDVTLHARRRSKQAAVSETGDELPSTAEPEA